MIRYASAVTSKSTPAHGEMMDYEKRIEAVELYAPYPRHEPSHAGFTGFAITSAALISFLAMAGLEMKGRIALAGYALMMVGFLGPYLYFDAARRRHFRELTRLELGEATSAPWPLSEDKPKKE